jgi:regulatory protein
MLSLAEARLACLHWQALREHSRAELAHKLQAKGFDDAIIAEVLDRLAEEGLQSDGCFLESFVRSRYSKGHGVQQIRLELRPHGISGEALDLCLSEYDWDELLERVHRKKFGDGLPVSPREYAARLRFLSQRGFEQNRIQAFLRRLRRGEED